MASKLKSIAIDEVSFVDKGASGNDQLRPRVVLFKRKEQSVVDRIVSLFRKSVEDVVKENPTMDIQSIMSKLSPEEQAFLKQAMAKADAPAPAPKPADELAKALAALPPEARKAIEDAEAAKVAKAKADEDEKVELKKRLAKIEEDREIETFEKRAAEFAHIPGMSTAELAKVLRSSSKSLSADEFKKLEASLKSADDAVKKSNLFGEHGSSVSGDPASAYGKIQAIAKSLREKNPKLTEAQAVLEATEQHPELEAQYRKEQE